jgi:hypothetical protein
MPFILPIPLCSNSLLKFSYLDEVITNFSGAVDAKYRQMMYRLILIHKPPWANTKSFKKLNACPMKAEIEGTKFSKFSLWNSFSSPNSTVQQDSNDPPSKILGELGQ